MIGLHVDDRPLLEWISTILGTGIVINNKENTVSYFIITDTERLKTILFPIFDNFPLNTTKHLDYLSFKEALELAYHVNLSSLDNKNRTEIIDKIVDLKNKMNNKRTNFYINNNHIRITPYWLLGLIEGEASFQLYRKELVPAFSLSLNEIQRPVIEAIIQFLTGKLDKYSLFKATHSKLFNLSIDSPKSTSNTKSKLKLSITQLDYLINIFIPFLDTMVFKSKKGLDFEDFKFISTLIYQGKHLRSEIKDLILKISYSRNNFRLSTNKEKLSLKIVETPFLRQTELSKEELKINLKIFNSRNSYLSNLEKEVLLSEPSLIITNDEGAKINMTTGATGRHGPKLIRDVYVVEVENIDKTSTIYLSIIDCAKALGVSRATISKIIKTGNSLKGTTIVKIRKIPIFRKNKHTFTK